MGWKWQKKSREENEKYASKTNNWKVRANSSSKQQSNIPVLGIETTNSPMDCVMGLTIKPPDFTKSPLQATPATDETTMGTISEQSEAISNLPILWKTDNAAPYENPATGTYRKRLQKVLPEDKQQDCKNWIFHGENGQ